MAKKRFNLDDSFNDVVNFIETPKENPAQSPAQPAEVPQQEPAPAGKKEEPVSYKEPNKLFRRNITLSEEVYWCLNYIKDRKNKNRTDGAKFVAIDGLMFEMIQHCLDTQYASVKKKFEEYKKEEAEDWI